MEPFVPFLPIGNGDLPVARAIVSKNKIKWAIKSFPPHKSVGEDGIFPAMLQWCSDIIDRLCAIFVASIYYKYIPMALRGVRVVFIPKIGKVSSHLLPSF